MAGKNQGGERTDEASGDRKREYQSNRLGDCGGIKELLHGLQICSTVETNAEAEAEAEANPVPEVARAAEEVIKGRGNCGRKRKSAALEADEPEPEPWRTPVARMY